jgi:hypothetical protein
MSFWELFVKTRLYLLYKYKVKFFYGGKKVKYFEDNFFNKCCMAM